MYPGAPATAACDQPTLKKMASTLRLAALCSRASLGKGRPHAVGTLDARAETASAPPRPSFDMPLCTLLYGQTPTARRPLAVPLSTRPKRRRPYAGRMDSKTRSLYIGDALRGLVTAARRTPLWRGLRSARRQRWERRPVRSGDEATDGLARAAVITQSAVMGDLPDPRYPRVAPALRMDAINKYIRRPKGGSDGPEGNREVYGVGRASPHQP